MPQNEALRFDTFNWIQFALILFGMLWYLSVPSDIAVESLYGYPLYRLGGIFPAIASIMGFGRIAYRDWRKCDAPK